MTLNIDQIVDFAISSSVNFDSSSWCQFALFVFLVIYVGV